MSNDNYLELDSGYAKEIEWLIKKGAVDFVKEEPYWRFVFPCSMNGCQWLEQ